MTPAGSSSGSRGQGCSRLAASLVLIGLLSAPAVRAEAPPESRIHALLINGGSRPAANYLSHLHHLQDMVELLERRGLPRQRIHVFSADGEDDAADLAVRELPLEGFWLLAGTRLGRQLRPKTELEDTRWAGIKLRPARKSELREWFDWAGEALAPGDELLIFVTDHGTVNRENLDNGAISLWKEKLEVHELAKLVADLQPGVRTVMIMSQCYSGSFASLIFPGGNREPSGEICGFFSTRRDLKAFGCYPEGRDRDRIGHAFHFIDALDRQANTVEAHREVLVTDDTPDVPLRTSDVYLERVVAAEADARGLDEAALVDRLLAEAWLDRAAWEPDIRLLDRIGHAFGTFSPRSLAELETYQAELPPLIERMKTFADRWRTTLNDVKQENLTGLLSERPEWRERLEDPALEKLDNGERKALLEELLPELERRTRARADLWDRLAALRERAGKASRARWRLETREGALRRMRSILVGIAGRVLLERGAEDTSDDRRRVYDGLASCETFEPGTFPGPDPLLARPPATPAYPPLAEERRLVDEILPSWLGVRYREVPAALRTDRELPEGAAWLAAVYPDSPAGAAGLEAGDVVLGTADRLFSAAGNIREWTMTSPRDRPLSLRILRPADRAEEDRELELTVRLESYPVVWPELPGPPGLGQRAPALPSSVQPVGKKTLPELSGKSHLLFFWATWCRPCKAAVPEIRAFAEAKGVPVIAVSDEPAEAVRRFLQAREGPFFDWVAVDPLRRSFIGYGVSGTPTLVWVDESGVVRHRQVGYSPKQGLTVDGWRWASQ